MASFTIASLDHVSVAVTDVDRAKRFYSELLGLQEVPRPPTFTFPGAWYRLPNSMLHLVPARTPPAAGPWHFAIMVSDVHAAARDLEAGGFAVRWDHFKIPGVERFHTADPDGNHIEIQGSDGTLQT